MGIRRLFVLAAVVVIPLNVLADQPPRQKPEVTSLRVAIYAFLPEANTGVEQLKERFEKENPSIDIDFELWDPYSDAIADRGLGEIDRFDIVEVDACRLAELAAGKFGTAGGLDPLPNGIAKAPDEYVPPATAIMKGSYANYVLPHWVCGMFLVYRSDNKAIDQATSFDEFKKALDAGQGKPMLGDLWGATGLGEFYAHAVVDILGPAKAAEHLRSLAAANAADPSGTQKLVEKAMDPTALQAVIDIKALLPAKFQDHLKYYHAPPLAEIYPDTFAQSPRGVLFGYSERLYYAERARRLAEPSTLPAFKASELKVKKLSLGPSSRGTPTWIDTFVIPKGRLQSKRQAIETFLRFIDSPPAYACFIHVADDLPASYLLPATRTEYTAAEVQKGEPLLLQYENLLDDSFPVLEPEIWLGMRAAGPVIKTKLGPQN